MFCLTRLVVRWNSDSACLSWARVSSTAVFADSNWVKFGQRAGIDLRSLPYCFLALDKGAPVSDRRIEDAAAPDAGQRPALLSRIIGRPEHFKPYARVLNCDATGLAELELPKRSDPTLFKQLDRTKAPLVYRWRRDGDKILGGEAVSRANPDASAALDSPAAP